MQRSQRQLENDGIFVNDPDIAIEEEGLDPLRDAGIEENDLSQIDVVEFSNEDDEVDQF